ncbi:MAG: bifunctional oligoribonuclease/PAP phosphatase NrnA [Clostridiales bacterium]|nr:bifunctional oligoribonuclease/PAP phosphatase NrnA [Clostridiales bacterium]
MNSENFTQKLYDALQKAETIALSAHINADGDAIGSTLAMAAALEAMGKKPVVFLYYKGSKFDYILDREKIYTGNKQTVKPDVFISLDCGDIFRLGDKGRSVFENSPLTFNIDHHISNIGYGDYNYIFPEASSTCELVYEVIKGFPGFKLTKYIAECLYTGLITDTYSFKHSSTGRRTLEIAADLIETGIDFSEIQAATLYRKDMAEAKIHAKALLNAELEGKTAYTTLTLKEIRSVGAIFEQLSGIAESCLNITGADVSVFVYDKGNGTIRCSFRSMGIDVNKVAMDLGGGGHVRAAGCTLENSTVEDALEKCLKGIREKIERESK